MPGFSRACGYDTWVSCGLKDRSHGSVDLESPCAVLHTVQPSCAHRDIPDQLEWVSNCVRGGVWKKRQRMNAIDIHVKRRNIGGHAFLPVTQRVFVPNVLFFQCYLDELLPRFDVLC
jgi:hypothetical protein